MHFLFSSIHVTLVFSCCEYVNSLMIETGTTILLRLPKNISMRAQTLVWKSHLCQCLCCVSYEGRSCTFSNTYAEHIRHVYLDNEPIKLLF